jgi:hypothetical protein
VDARGVGPRRKQGALGGGNDACRARVELQRAAQRAREGLEHGLALVVRIDALEVVDVQRHAGVVHEALEEFVGQLAVEGRRSCRW